MKLKDTLGIRDTAFKDSVLERLSPRRAKGLQPILQEAIEAADELWRRDLQAVYGVEEAGRILDIIDTVDINNLRVRPKPRSQAKPKRSSLQ